MQWHALSPRLTLHIWKFVTLLVSTILCKVAISR